LKPLTAIVITCSDTLRVGRDTADQLYPSWKGIFH